MKFEIKQALTTDNCQKALTLSTQLYNSTYSDNEGRMFFASAHACNVGIHLYSLLDDITNSNFTTQDAIFKTLVRLFPSASTDSKMASSWFAEDALQSILIPGAVVATSDRIAWTSSNPGSDLSQDRTLDANTYLLFIGMSVIGTTLNRYGYSAGQSPAAMNYTQGQNLPWTSKALVISDTTGAACALVSGFYSLFDGINAIIGQMSGGASSSLQNILTNLQGAISAAGTFNCTADGYSAAQCAAAAVRIRYRGACAEQDPAASFAAGVIQAINAGWL